MSLININQTSFDHTFQSNVTFLSNSFFQSNAIVASGAKLEVNGTSTFIGVSDFSSAVTFKSTVSVDSSITGQSLQISSSATLNNITINGKLFDGDGDFGTSGQLLASDGTDTVWIDASSTSVANANNVGVNVDSTNADQYVTFVGSTSGNNPIRVDSDLKYNPSTNTLSPKTIEFADNDELRFGDGNDLKISHTDSLSSQNDSNGDSIVDGDTSFIEENGTGGLIFKTNGGPGDGAYQFFDANWRPILKLFSGNSARAALYHGGSEKLITSSTGVTVTGTVAATSFSGNASTATKLATARTISGVSFDGTANITLNNANITNGAGYVTSAGAIPAGAIVLWSGAVNTIPNGWALCNGQNSTPDLRDRFVIGAGNNYAVNATGGSANATLVSHSHTVDNHTHSDGTLTVDNHTHGDGSLTVDNHTHGDGSLTVANHTHGSGSLGTNNSGNHSHSYSRLNSNSSYSRGVPIGDGGQAGSSFGTQNTNNGGSHSHNVNGSTGGSAPGVSGSTAGSAPGVNGSTGGSAPGVNGSTGGAAPGVNGNTGGSTPGTNAQGSSATNANLPPYYALCYIMKT